MNQKNRLCYSSFRVLYARPVACGVTIEHLRGGGGAQPKDGSGKTIFVADLLPRAQASEPLSFHSIRADALGNPGPNYGGVKVGYLVH